MVIPITISLLVELAAIVIASSAFLFYFNRLGGWIVGQVLRYLWWKKYNIYITIGSIQLSLLAGRVSFRDLEYHSSNISARALHGHVTWRYWRFRTKQNEDVDTANSSRGSLPCRMRVHAEGVEAFIYNTTPAYDEIVRRMEKHEAAEAAGMTPDASETWSSNEGHGGIRQRSNMKRSQTKGSSGSSSNDLKAATSGTSKTPLTAAQNRTEPTFSMFHEMCPIEISLKQGSVILGNDATPSVLIAHFLSATGTVNHVESSSPCDDGRQDYDLKFETVKILTRTNVDYSGPLLAHGKKAYDELLDKRPLTAEEPPSLLSTRSGFHRIAQQFKFLRDPRFSTPPIAGLPRDRVWRGLARYRDMDDEAPHHQLRREEREYAKVTTLVDTPRLDVHYYSDEPGPVPYPGDPVIVNPADEFGNVEAPPEYGIEVTIHGGMVTYGPWADRQRDALQTAFAPSIFFNSVPKAPLQPGDQRIHTHMLLNVNLVKETTLRIPTREPSKDWRFDGANASDERPYGWLDVTVAANSSVVYTQSQVATTHGYDTMLALHLDSLSISSSVNVNTFLKAKSCKLAITMPTPLQWDAQRDWGFDITMDEPEITLMRDHTTLISDLARDWSSGLQGDFHHFVPNHYNFRVSILNYGIHLFMNDFNIIDLPGDRAANAMADFYGPRLDAYIAVSATQYRPEFSVVPFSVEAKDIRVEIGLPLWDTHRGVDGSLDVEIGKIGDISIEGSYRFYAEPKPDHQETLTLHLEGRRLAFKALGWALRRLFCIKDNYFGGFTQFQTMDEYQARHDYDPESVGDPVEEKYRPGRSDPFAVQVTMNVEDSLLLMADTIYGCESGVVMPIPKLQMSLRSQDQFMDLSLDSPPTFVVPVHDLASVYTSCVVPPIEDDAIFVEGIELKANRLFGPQPRAETYLCLWEAVVPRITCSLSIPFVATLQAVAESVQYNFADLDNAPRKKYQPAALPDVTFFKVRLGEAIVKLSSENSAISVELAKGLNLDLSTWATRSCGYTVGVLVPAINIVILRADPVDRGRWNSVAEAQTGGSFDIYLAERGWRDAAAKQQAFLRKEDAETRRIAYLYDDGKPPRYGQFNHQVFIATPHPSEIDTVSDEEDTDYDSAATSMYDRSSSPESGGHDDMAFARPRPRRNSTIRRDRVEEDIDSDGDLSGSASTCSSTSELDLRDPTDIPSSLADLLRRFRAVKQSMLDSIDLPDDGVSDHDERLPPTALRSGTVVKVSLVPVALALQPSALQAGSSLYEAFKNTPRRSEVLLDGIMVAHAEKYRAIDKIDSPLVVEIEVPHIRARAFYTDVNAPSPIVDCSVKRITTRVSRSSYAGHQYTNVAAWVRRMEVLLCTPKPALHLQDVESAGVPGQPVGRVLFEGLEVGLDSRSRHTVLTVRLNMFNTGIVTPAFDSIRDIAQIWQAACSVLPSSVDQVKPVAFVICDAIQSAIATGQTGSQPLFMTPTGYALQENDPVNVRRDEGWALLARLRYWTQTLPRQPVERITDITSYAVTELGKIEARGLNKDEGKNPNHDGVLDDNKGGLLEQSGEKEPTVDSSDWVREQTFIKLAFGQEIHAEPSTHTTLLDHTTHVFANLDLLHLEHQGKMLESDQIVSSSLNIMSASTGLQYLVGYKRSRPIKRIRLVNTVKAIDVVLQNSIFNAIEPLLSLVPAPVSADNNHAEKDDADSRTILVMDNQIQRAELQLIAAGLRIKGLLDQGSLNVNHESGIGLEVNKTPISSQMTSNMMVSSMETVVSVVKERTHSASSMPTGVVATWETKDFGGMASHVAYQEPSFPDEVKVLLSLRRFDLDVRPQMKALHGLINHVRQEDLPYYKRVVERYKSLLPDQPSIDTESEEKKTHATIDLSFKSVALVARAASSLWVRWDLGNTFLTGSGTKDDLNFGIRMDPQEVGAYSSVKRSKSQDSSKLRLPSVRARGVYTHHDEQGSLSGTLDLGVFQGVMRPATLNRLLDLHRDLGEDIAILSRQYQDELKQYKAESPQLPDTVPRPLVLEIGINMAGIEIGLRADKVATSIVLEASALSGSLSHNGQSSSSLEWDAKATQFGVSLGHLKSDMVSDDIKSARRYRSASMVLDVEVKDIPAIADTPRQLQVHLSKAHSIMHVAALKELVDLSRSWSHDINVMQEDRADDIAQVKVDGNKLKQKMQSKAAQTDKPLSSAWLSERLVTIRMTGIGVAIPLDASTTIDLATVDQRPGPAMLFSIRRLTFENKRNQTARFTMKQMALQFVDVFDQSNSGHFQGDYHPSDNRMTVPEISSEAEISSEPGFWKVCAHSSATDFELKLSPSIADDIYRLVHMYHRGKSHIALLEEEYRLGLAKFGQPDTVVTKYIEQSSIPSKLAAQQILVKMSFTFNSGDVSLSHRPRDKSYKPDRLKLPTISLWVDYAGAAIGVDDSDDGGSLLINSAVHESQNTILPTIIPFIVDLVRRIRHHPNEFEDAKTTGAIPIGQSSLVQAEPSTVGVPALEAIAHAPTGRLKVQFTLRIDHSKLTLSCESGLEGMSDACLSLTWSSGGFVASVSPGTNEAASISGSITGVEIGLQHRHTNKNCLTASAKDMAFTAVYSPSKGQGIQPVTSFVFDTSISSGFRLDAYNAWLCFMAVWADDVWKFGTPTKVITPVSTPNPVAPTSTDKLAYAVIARVRKISFDVLLPVTQAILQIDPLIIRTTSDGKQTDLEVSVGTLNLHAKGDIWGDITSRHLTMVSTRQSTRANESHTSSTLVLAISAGDLTGNAYLEDVRIVQFHLAATKVSLSDDWSARNADPDQDPVLAFEIDAGRFVSVVRLQEVPGLLGLFYRIMGEAETQEARAKQLSKPYRENQARKSGQPSALTSALLQSARRVSLTEASPCQMKIKQVMKLAIAGVDLGMFVTDNEGGRSVQHFYLFEIGSVDVNLARKQNVNGHPLRDIKVVMDAAEWTYYGNENHLHAERHGESIVELAKMKYQEKPKPDKGKDKGKDKVKDKPTQDGSGKEDDKPKDKPKSRKEKQKTGIWAGAQAAYVPHATVTMSSDQIPSEPVDVLEHDCSLRFTGDKADVQFHSTLWNSASAAFRQLSHDLDEQQRSRARDRGSFTRVKQVTATDGQDEYENPAAIIYKRTGGSIEVPDLAYLGDFTKDLVKWIPNLQSNMDDKCPVVVHRFVTVPLEDAMDQLLKLYEKHLPAASHDGENEVEFNNHHDKGNGSIGKIQS